MPFAQAYAGERMVSVARCGQSQHVCSFECCDHPVAGVIVLALHQLFQATLGAGGGEVDYIVKHDRYMPEGTVRRDET